jgi:hypothetical protein
MKKAQIAMAAVVVVALIAGGAWLALRGGDDERTAVGTCGDATYELAAETEDNGLEAAFELQSASPAETWNVAVEQDGATVFEGDRQTDEDAELDVDVMVNENDGRSSTVTATPESGEACTASLDS